MATEFALEDKDAQEFLKKTLEQVDKVKERENAYIGLISSVVFQDVMDHFARQKGSQGNWKKWSNFYTKIMNEAGKGGNKILQDTGRLRLGFIPKNYRSTTEGVLWFNPAKTKSGFPYAAAHNEGGPQLPKRDFMWLSDEAKEKIETLTLKFLEDV